MVTAVVVVGHCGSCGGCVRSCVLQVSGRYNCVAQFRGGSLIAGASGQPVREAGVGEAVVGGAGWRLRCCASGRC